MGQPILYIIAVNIFDEFLTDENMAPIMEPLKGRTQQSLYD
jgi:hypothetical protein